MRALVIAEHDHRALSAATLAAITAAGQVTSEIDLLIAGENCRALAELGAKTAGVMRVLVADAAVYRDQLPESLTRLIEGLAVDYGYVIAGATAFSKGLLARLAARLDVAAISDVVAIESGDTFVRPIYAGSLLATERSDDPIRVLTVRATAFAPAGTVDQAAVITEIAEIGANADLPASASRLLSQEAASASRTDLASAQVVVAGGRGLGSAENFQQVLEPLAEALGAALAGSRAAVDGGFIANQFQVGQTGKVVAPMLYIAVGISGAIQHLAGMKESQVIVAINRDEHAPIFQVADFGLVGDLFELVPALTVALNAAKGNAAA